MTRLSNRRSITCARSLRRSSGTLAEGWCRPCQCASAATCASLDRVQVYWAWLKLCAQGVDDTQQRGTARQGKLVLLVRKRAMHMIHDAVNSVPPQSAHACQ